MRKYNILLVDDDPFILKSIGPYLKDKGYQVTTAESGELAVEALSNKDVDPVITDLVMEGINGIDVLKKAKELNSETKVIIITGYGDMTSAIDALKLSAEDYLLKPCEAEEIFFRVRKCIEELKLQRKIKLYEKILPVCCQCKKIRDDSGKEPGTGEWISVERFIWDKAKLDITSTYCPECAQELQEKIDRELPH